MRRARYFPTVGATPAAGAAAAPASPPRYAPISSTGMRPWPEAWVWAAARLMSGPITVASVDRTPDALRRDGHVEVFDAEFGERVDDRVDDGAERRRRAAFAAAAQAERVRRRGYFAELGHERWQRVRAWQRVVHQRRGSELTGGLLIRAELPQRLADAGGDAAVRLAVQDHRIHCASDVVHGRVSDDIDDAGVGIHFHFAHRAAVRIRRHRHDLGARAGKRLAGTNTSGRGLEQIDGAVGALHGEPAPCEFDIRLRGLEERRRDAPALFDDLIRGFGHDDGAKPHRAAGRRTAAYRHQIRVTGDELHVPELDAEPLDDELGEARFVSLVGGKGAEDHIDAAFGPHGDLGALARITRVQLDVVREADAAVPSAATRIGAPGLESLPVRQLDQAIQGGGVVAAVVDQADSVAIRHRARLH